MKLFRVSVFCLFSSLVFVGAAKAGSSESELTKPSRLALCQEAITAECKIYLLGIVDGALMYAKDPSPLVLSSEDFESRALKYRAAGRYKTLNKAYCTQKTIDHQEVELAIEEQVELKAIGSLEEMKVFMTSMLKCNNP